MMHPSDEDSSLPITFGNKVLSKKDVDDLLEKYLHEPKVKEIKEMIRIDLQDAYSQVQVYDRKSITTFFKLASQAYFILEEAVPYGEGFKSYGPGKKFKRYLKSKEESGESYKGDWMEFHETFSNFKNYFGIYSPEQEKDAHIHYYAITQALDFFLRQEDYDRAQGFLMALECLSLPALPVLRQSIWLYFLDPKTAEPKKSPPHFKRLKELYQAPLKARGIDKEDYSVIDNIVLFALSRFGEEFEDAVAYGTRALTMPWPSRENPEYAIRMTPNNLKQSLVYMCYQLEKYTEAKKIYASNRDNGSLTSKIVMALIYAQEDDITQATIYLTKALDNMGELCISQNDALPLAELLLKVKKKDFNLLRNRALTLLKRSVTPSLKNDIERLIREKDKEKNRNLIKTKIG